MAKDPVCGMNIDPENALFTVRHQNQLFFFCCRSCQEAFKQNPDNYLSAQKQIKFISSAAEYTCPMHPEVVQDHPGNCPICGMALEAKNGASESDDAEYKDMRLRFWIGLLFCLPVFLLAMGSMLSAFDHFMPIELSRWLQFILSTPVVVWAGWPFFERGWRSIVNRHLNMFSLISMGVGVAYLYSVMAFFFRRPFRPLFHCMPKSLFTLSRQLS